MTNSRAASAMRASPPVSPGHATPVRSAACPSRVARPAAAAPDQADPPASPRSSRPWHEPTAPRGCTVRRPPYSADDPHAHGRPRACWCCTASGHPSEVSACGRRTPSAPSPVAARRCVQRVPTRSPLRWTCSPMLVPASRARRRCGYRRWPSLLDSPELGSPARRSRGGGLLSWRVPTIELDPAGALAWLATVADSSGADGIRCGASLRYLAGLAAFAGELVERGRVLPTVVRDEDRWRAGGLRCRPRRGRVRGAGHAMPPVCRAELGQEDAHDLVADALHVFTDAAARDRLGPGVDPGAAAARPPSETRAAVEAWLAALTAADGRFDADDDELGALERELRPWAEIGTGRVGPAGHLPAQRGRIPVEIRRVRRLAAGVPAAVHPGPQSARAGRPGVVG